jgi:DNA helicase HerA-like ATPase
VHLLESLRWLRMLTVPRRDTNGPGADHGDPAREGIFAALTGAHAELVSRVSPGPGLLGFCCLRPAGQRQVQYLAAGRPWFPPGPATGEGVPEPAASAPVPVLYPPGSTGVAVPADSVTSALLSLPVWLRCTGGPDALSGSVGERKPGPGGLRSPFDDYVAHLTGPFGWLVVAQPVPAAELQAERTRLLSRVPMLRQRENSPEHQIELERTQARYRELTRARAAGTWSVHIFVGGLREPDARRAAGLLCSASDLDDVPYVLVPGPFAGPLPEVIAAPLADGEVRSPFLATAELLGSVARPPEREIAGIRTVAPLSFDVTPETVGDAADVLLGEVLDSALGSVGELRVPYGTLNRHAFVCGATGSGKSQTARGLLESLTTAPQPVPWLVVEPAKAEYARMAGRLGARGEVLRIRPGDLDSAPASLNPLEPEPDYPLQSHADLVRALFLAAFEAQEPFPQVLAQALTRCYTRAGWDLVNGRPRPAVKPVLWDEETPEPVRPRYPTLGELQSAAREVVDAIGYGKEVAADVRGFVDVRIGSLREGTAGRFFEGGHPLDIGELLRQNVVLELEPVTNDQDKAFFMGAVLIRIVEHLRVRDRRKPADGLSHVLLIEEAHRLLKNVEHGPAAAAVELFAALLAEIRAYGEGVVVVEQIPSKIVPDVLKNTALKVMHRLPAKDDREAVGATMNLTSGQSDAVVALAPGLAAVTADGADRPLLVQMTLGEDRESDRRCTSQPPLKGRRSLLCGPDCRRQACSLTQLNEARAIADEPSIVTWVEAAAAAMVIGLNPPGPRLGVRQRYDLPRREQDCALATAADRAVDARRPFLRGYADPDDFAAELAAVLRRRLAGDSGPVPERDRWKVGYYRFYGARAALEHAVGALAPGEAEQAPPHHLTATWAARGLVLESSTLGGQLREAPNHPAFADGKAAVLGDQRSSGLRKAMQALAGPISSTAASRGFTYACSGEHLKLLLEVVCPLVSGS